MTVAGHVSLSTIIQATHHLTPGLLWSAASGRLPAPMSMLPHQLGKRIAVKPAVRM